MTYNSPQQKEIGIWGKTNLTPNKRPNYEKLLACGFVPQDEKYVFTTYILNGDFRLVISATDKETTLQVIDTATEEEYSLVYMLDAVGVYIGRVRETCEAIVTDIVDKCYEVNVFQNEYTKKVIWYVAEKYGVSAAYLWEKFPNHAVFRDIKTGKWFATLARIEKRIIENGRQGFAEFITLKEKAENIQKLIDGKKYFPAYHMNKKHWYTIGLDGSVPLNELYRRKDVSFDLLHTQNQRKK